MYSLARKNHLARNLGRMLKAFPEDYKFYPKTWLLPSEYSDFRSQFQNKKKSPLIWIVFIIAVIFIIIKLSGK